MDDLLGSDYFPIVIDIVDEIAVPRSPRWLLDKDDWSLFSTLALLEVDAKDFLSVDEALEYQRVVVTAAKESISRSKGKYLRNLISFKRACARFRFQVKQAKRQSWVNVLSTINWKTTLPEVWNKIRKISAKYIPSPQPVIRINDYVIADPKDASEAFATHFAKVSSKKKSPLIINNASMRKTRI